jgi:integration host factor subunit beta
MTKSQLVDRIAEKAPNVPRREVEAMVNAVFDSMLAALKRSERIEIRGFGSFAVKTRGARDGRNPKTGQKVSVPERRTLSFTVGKELRDRLNPGDEPRAVELQRPESAASSSSSSDALNPEPLAAAAVSERDRLSLR